MSPRKRDYSYDTIYKPTPVHNIRGKHVKNLTITQEIKIDLDDSNNNEPIICKSKNVTTDSDTGSVIRTNS